jgi:hypothetical protein
VSASCTASRPQCTIFEDWHSFPASSDVAEFQKEAHKVFPSADVCFLGITLTLKTEKEEVYTITNTSPLAFPKECTAADRQAILAVVGGAMEYKGIGPVNSSFAYFMNKSCYDPAPPSAV